MSSRSLLLVLATTVLFSTPQLFAQEGEIPTIATDRPSVSYPPDVVPAHSLQMENGLNFQYSRSSYAVDLPESALRMGIGLRTELRFATTNMMHTSGATGAYLQPQDVSFGWKTSLTKANGMLPQAMLLAFNCPTGAEQQTSGSFDQEAILIWQQSLPRGLVLIENIGLLRTTFAGARVTNWMPQVYVAHPVSRRTGAFAEYAPTLLSDGNALHIVDGGFAWNPVPTRQFDVRAGFQNDPAGRHNLLSFGYSVRLDGLAPSSHRSRK